MVPSNSRSRRVLINLILGLTLWAGHGSAQTIGSRDPEAALFRYDPLTISDEQLRDVVDAIAADSDFSTWPKIQILRGDGLLKIVDRAYDYFGSTEPYPAGAARPLTALRLAEIIKDKNGLKTDLLEEGKYLSIPPVTVRPYLRVSGGAFTPTYGSILVMPSNTGNDVLWNDATFTKGGGARKVEYMSKTNQHAWNADAFGDLGLRWTESVVVRLNPLKAQQLAQANSGSVIPKERVTMELLQASECRAPFEPSAYQASARAALAAVVSELSTRAAKAPLVIIDHNFDGGHGSQVRSVVDKLLEDLGVGALTKFVRNVDLNPNAKRDLGVDAHPLTVAMTSYGSYLATLGVIADDARKNGADWFVFPNEASNGGLTVRIAPYVLQAAIQSSLAQGAWLNMSWRGDRTDWVMPIEFEKFLAGRNSFAVVAAGNELEDIKTDRSPQDASSKYSKFVNVTSATAAGIPCGSRTGSQGVRVHLMAQGVITSVSTKQTISGSSFASPLVATAAWLKHLKDGTPAGRMREKLIGASTYLPSQQVRTVDARGVFDPAKLIVGLGPHYIDAANGAHVAFSSMQLDAGSCGAFSYANGAEAINDLVVFDRGGSLQLAVRSATEEFPHLKERDLCAPPATLKVSFTLESGETRTIEGAAEFAKSIRLLHF